MVRECTLPSHSHHLEETQGAGDANSGMLRTSWAFQTPCKPHFLKSLATAVTFSVIIMALSLYHILLVLEEYILGFLKI